MALLNVEGLGIDFHTRAGLVRAVRDVSFTIAPGEILGMVGESGSGKSVTAQSLLGILEPAGHVVAGRADFGGLDLLTASPRAMKAIRGRAIGMVFQNPRAALNPVLPVGRQIEDVLVHVAALPRHQARARAIELLSELRIADPARSSAALPHALSGGMCQRVMIAIAIAASPKLLIADEPTTGLDVTTQAAIMALLARQIRSRGMAMLLITHDLALAGEHCDRIAVMHAGHLVETGPADAVLNTPLHPYTSRLVATVPLGKRSIHALHPIPGALPDLASPLPPCRYALRCDRHAPRCDSPLPHLTPQPGRDVACHDPIHA